MLIEIFKNRSKIWEGLKNKIFRDEHVEAIYLDRRAVCDGCDHKDIEGVNCAVPGTKPCCTLCGCSLSLKLRSLSSECPDGKWKAVTNEQEEEMIRQQILNNRLGGS